MDTIVALSTPLGVSGIGLIRLSGSMCYDLACQIFKKGTIKPRYSYLGHYHLNNSNIVLDDPLFVYFEPGGSYTGEAMLEISCHGNPLILQQVIRDCITRGCRQAEPGEFTRRAFLNGVIDLCQAEAVEDLIHSQSLQAIAIAQKQLKGSLSQSMQSFIQTLTDQIAFVEAYLDFPEEDLPEENKQAFQEQITSMLHRIDQLIDLHRSFTPLHNGIRTAIVGAPNAGKSTLLNLLLGQERAIVSDVPGTTRDFISEYYHLGAYTLNLIDTAGIHASQEMIEKLGIQKTFEQIHKADCILWVVDGSEVSVEALQQLRPHLDTHKTLVIINKADLGICDEVKNFFENDYHCTTTLKQTNSLDCVKNLLSNFLDKHYYNFSQVEFLIHERHAEALFGAKQALEKSKELLKVCGYDDCLAVELKTALYAFEQIVGRVDYERILDKIFSTFCIGK